MNTRKQDTAGLKSIAQSTRARAAKAMRKPRRKVHEKPPLELTGQVRKTSVAFDAGMWFCAEELAFVLTRMLR